MHLDSSTLLFLCRSPRDMKRTSSSFSSFRPSSPRGMGATGSYVWRNGTSTYVCMYLVIWVIYSVYVANPHPPSRPTQYVVMEQAVASIYIQIQYKTRNARRYENSNSGLPPKQKTTPKKKKKKTRNSTKEKMLFPGLGLLCYAAQVLIGLLL